MPVPTIYVIAGCNGAGKTTFAKEFLPSVGVVRFLNADEIARGLSPLRPEVVAFKAGRLLLSELHELIERREAFALESTLSGRTYVNIFEQAKQCGYAIELHFVWIPDVREAIRRVRQRVIEGGHDVPGEDVQRRFAAKYSTSARRLRSPVGPLGAMGQLNAPCKTPRKFSSLFYFGSEEFFRRTMKNSRNGLKPIPEKKMPKWARVASQAHKRATRKKRAELRRRGLPMIIWKDGKVREVPA